jgi:hypothetical protein
MGNRYLEVGLILPIQHKKELSMFLRDASEVLQLLKKIQASESFDISSNLKPRDRNVQATDPTGHLRQVGQKKRISPRSRDFRRIDHDKTVFAPNEVAKAFPGLTAKGNYSQASTLSCQSRREQPSALAQTISSQENCEEVTALNLGRSDTIWPSLALSLLHGPETKSRQSWREEKCFSRISLKRTVKRESLLLLLDKVLLSRTKKQADENHMYQSNWAGSDKRRRERSSDRLQPARRTESSLVTRIGHLIRKAPHSERAAWRPSRPAESQKNEHFSVPDSSINN